MKPISAAEANRQFSSILSRVKDGETFVVTSRGSPVAIIAPADRVMAAREAAKEILLKRLRAQQPLNAGRWTRDELYDDEP